MKLHKKNSIYSSTSIINRLSRTEKDALRYYHPISESQFYEWFGYEPEDDWKDEMESINKCRRVGLYMADDSYIDTLSNVGLDVVEIVDCSGRLELVTYLGGRCYPCADEILRTVRHLD